MSAAHQEEADPAPTVGQILALDVVRRGQPRVLACAGRLGTRVRWVHAIELADAARLLRGGEMVLTTGIALPADGAAVAGYVADLAAVGVSALAVELGRRYTGGLPPEFAAAAREHGLPLIVFEREIPFIEITEAVHGRIIDSQLEQLRASARLHEVFTDLAVAGAGPTEIVRQAALLAGRPVILTDLEHHVLACEPAGADPARLLAGFEARSRLVAPGARTAYDAPSGWLVTMVGARGEDWGRVVLVCGETPSPADMVLVERAATTLALARLLTRRQEGLLRQAHSALFGTILARGDADPDQAAVRARALGVPVTGRRLLPLVLRFPGTGPGLAAQARVLEAAEAAAEACRAHHVPALAGTLDESRAAALLSVGRGTEPDRVLATVCSAIQARIRQQDGRSPGGGAGEVVIGAGSAVESMREVRRALLEARQVADAAARAPADPGGHPYARLADLRLRGLLHMLNGDARLATFTDRELGPLLAYDAAHGTTLTGVLAAYLEAGGNKAQAAARAHLSRPTLYGRLRHIERILGVSLEAAESRVCLHVALLALQWAGPPGTPPPPDGDGDGG